jgi:hypothetical protein
MVPLILGLVLIFFFRAPAWSSSPILLNEVHPNPVSGQKEWVEIYNSDSVSQSISGWKIKEKTGSGTTTTHSLPSFTLPAGSVCFYEFGGSSLNNDQDTVSLEDNASVEVDSFAYTSTVSGKSFSRIPDGSLWSALVDPSKSSSCDSLTTTETGATPSTPSTTTGLHLNEAMVNPEVGALEWVELYNDNVVTLGLGGFKIDDNESGSQPISLPNDAAIAAKGYFYYQLTNAIFNNDADSVRLLSPSGEELSKFSYSTSQKGASWAKNSQGHWSETTTPTLGQPNSFTQVQAFSTKTPTKKAEPTSKKSTVTTTGSVLAQTSQLPISESTQSASSSSTISKIKLNLEEEAEPLVKAQGYSKFMSLSFIIVGVVVLGLPSLIIYRKRKNG